MQALAALLVARCVELPMVKAAWLVQLFAPLSEQLTSPLVVLELTAPLPPDAFAGWPAEHPLVVMALGDDAVSRLVRLARPVYVTPWPGDLAGLAAVLAAAVGGRVLEVPSDPAYPALAVALPSGAVSILIRGFSHDLRVNVPGRSWDVRPGLDAAAIVPEIASHAGDLPMVALALTLAEALAAEFEERWTVSIPGTPAPSEMWLHGAEPAAASVGVFADGRAIVWIGDEARTGDAATVIAGVTEQRARYQRHLAAAPRIRALAEALAGRLTSRLGTAFGWRATGHVSHERTIGAEIAGATAGATLFLDGDRIRAHAGLPGDDGWEAELTDLDAQLEGIALAIERRQLTLTVHDLQPGRRYRVLHGLQELEAGAIVRYLGLDDIDNHYGEYGFETETGEKRVVAGDCSEPSRGPLAEVHRYLTPSDE